MKKGVKITIIILTIIIVGLLSYFITNKITTNYIKNNKTVDDISVEKFIEKFNKNLEDNNFKDKLELKDENAVNKTYWINLNDDVTIALLVDNVKSDKVSATVRITGLSYKDEVDKDEMEKYLKVLIKTNNEKLSNNEIEKMIKNANDMTDIKEKNGEKTSNTFEYKGLGIDKNIKSDTIIYRIARYK